MKACTNSWARIVMEALRKNLIRQISHDNTSLVWRKKRAGVALLTLSRFSGLFGGEESLLVATQGQWNRRCMG